MNKFWLLYKVAIKSNVLSSSSAMGTVSKKRKLGSVSGMLLIFAVLTVYMFFMAYTMGKSLSSMGQTKLLLTLAIMGGAAFVFINCAFSGVATVFKAKDYEFLTALPLSNGLVLAAKMAAAFTTVYLYITPIYIPFVTIYFVFEGVTAAGVIFAILGFLLSPMLIFTIGLLVGLVLSLVTSRLKLGRILYIVLMLAFIVGIMVISANPEALNGFVAANGNKVFSVVNTVFYPMGWFANAIMYASGLNFLYYALVNVLPTAVLLLLCAKFYVPIVNILNRTGAKRKFVYKEATTSKALPALMKKEFKKLFSSTNYLLNSCLGPALFLIFAVLNLFDINFGMVGSGADVASYTILMGALFVLISSPALASISLEGESFWILKSLPVKPITIFNAKLLTQFVIFVPLTFIASIIAVLAQGLGAATLAAALFFFLGVNLYGATLALMLGIKYHNLHYTNEMMVIKQGTAVFIYMLVNMVISIPALLVYGFIKAYLSLALYLTIFGAVFLIVGCVLYAVLYYKKANTETLNSID